MIHKEIKKNYRILTTQIQLQLKCFREYSSRPLLIHLNIYMLFNNCFTQKHYNIFKK
jgi:hypothetical protein